VPSFKKKQIYVQEPYNERPSNFGSSEGGIPNVMSEHYLQNFQAQ